MPFGLDEIVHAKNQVAMDIRRVGYLAERVVCVGGQPGCGKSLMNFIIGSFANVEIHKYNYALEYICSLHVLGKLDDGTATAMVEMLTDLDLYNMMMSRETNFRPSDCSSVFQNPGCWRYLRRLFQPGDAAVVERIKAEQPILHLMIHNLLILSPTLLKALGARVRIIEVVRHPLYMIKQWFLYIDRYGAEPRDFGICLEFQGGAVPFFARGWEERYMQSNAMDRVIYSIESLSQVGERIWQGLSDAQRAQSMVVPFERFVLDPWPFLCAIEELLGTTMTPLTRRELKRQRVPRSRLADGLPLPVYKRCGWEPPAKGTSEREELAWRRAYASASATVAGMATLDRLSHAYEERYLKGVL